MSRYVALPRERLEDDFEILYEQGIEAELLEDRSGKLFWITEVQTERGNLYEITIELPFGFPDQQPIGWINPQPRANQHTYANGSICVHDTPYDGRTWSPVIGFNLAWAWLEGYEDWLETGRFPSYEEVYRRLEG